MGDEFRETYYVREDGRPCLYAANVPCARIGMIQSAPNSGELRYVRMHSQPCLDPGEIDGRTPVLLLTPGVSHFEETVAKAMMALGLIN
jgi:hypothetical protein